MPEQSDKLVRLENLMEKIHQVEESAPQDNSETERIANALEQIMLRIEAIHNQKLKQEANRKLEQILQHLESTIGEMSCPRKRKESAR